MSAEFGVGTGYAPAHHGELLQGVFHDDAGLLRRALVTLPQTTRGTRAVFHPSQSHWGVVGSPGLTKVRRAAVLALREFAGRPGAAKGGHIEILSDVPVGIGMGSSTSDVTATIRAVADYHGVTLSREELGRLAVLAECASDPIMIDDRVVLFAHRDGVVLETLGHRLPPLLVVGCDTRPGTRVDTDRFPPAEYTDREVGFFGVLRAALRRAMATEDVPLLGRVATASARINQRFLPKDNLEALLELCLVHGGCGVQVAHSGTVAGLLFDARSPGARESAARCAARIEAMGLVLTTEIGAVPDGAAEERAA
ncbi:GHMP family kinase ATP-binding protein [Longispora urticae]